jgi:hypothetical protein
MALHTQPDVLEERVLMFTAIHSHVDRQKLTPMTAVQDLDIRGEDASAFFDAYAKEFHVNLDELNMHWDSHFHSEAGLILNAVFIVIGCVTLAVCVLALLLFGGRMWSYQWVSPYAIYSRPAWIWSGVVSFCSWAVTWYRNRAVEPVTIADLIDAAEAGRWVKKYRSRK